MTPGTSVPESLRALAPGIAQHDAPGVAALLSPYVERLRAPLPASHVKDTADAIFAVCRTLYLHARSSEAIPLVHGLLDHCVRVGDRAQTRRAAGVCGVLAAETADLVGAIEYHVQALRIAAADEDRLEMARAWNNIGHAIGTSGRYELSARCYRRSLVLAEPLDGASQNRFISHLNLADNLHHLGQPAEGIRHGVAALGELESFEGHDAYNLILLRRSLARLLIAEDRMAEAAQHVAGAAALAEALGSPRASIAVDTIRAALDMARGEPDLALTRLDRALARAREIPATLHDTLACAVRAEEAAGNVARALHRLQELSDHVYGHGIERARHAIERTGLDAAEPATEHQREEARARLTSMLNPPSAPSNWTVLRRLAAGAVLRMDDTGWHGVRVGALVRALAAAWGSRPLQALELGLAAELHDIGMASIPAAILAKPGELNEAERAIVRKHPEAGAAMLLDDRHPRVLLAREIARYHHARWDGLGYPERVAGAAIPLGARMCAVADAYDMMVCGFGRAPRTMDEAMEELRRQAGLQFDPELVSCFDALVKGELDGLGVDPSSEPGMEAFQELVLSLKEDRGFV